MRSRALTSVRSRVATLAAVVAAPALMLLQVPAGDALAAAAAAPAQTQEVSVAIGGGTSNGYADRPEISPDGTRVTFDSNATNMSSDPSDAHQREVFERDLTAGVTHLVSLGLGRTAANNWSSFSWPDADGDLVTFTSDATNLTTPATSGRSVFVRNMNPTLTINGVPPQTTREVSVTSTGAPANGGSSRSMITPDGRFIAFDSTATNLSSSANGQSQEYLHDMVTGATTLVSSSATGVAGNGLSYRGMVSGDGTTMAFSSKATNLVPGDTNKQEDVFLKDLRTGAIRRVSNRASGAQSTGGARPYLSPDGRWVVFNSNDALLPTDANKHNDIYVYDTVAATLSLGSPGRAGAGGNGDSLRGFITNDGTRVVFNSFATNLVASDKNPAGDAFVYNRTTGVTTTLSLSPTGGPADGNSFRPVPSADGSRVTFLSRADNLVSPPPHAPSSVTPLDDATTDYKAFVVTLPSGTPPTR